MYTAFIRKRVRIFRKNRALLALALPGVLFVFIFAYTPMFGLLIAFKDYKFTEGILGSKWVGLQNFHFLFVSQDAWRITRNTILLNASFIVFGTVAAVGMALLMNEARVKWLNNFIQSALFLPYLLSWVLVGYFAFALLTGNGFVNYFVQLFGHDPIQWYLEPRYWPVILVLTTLWKGTGYASVIYLASMLGISAEYYEAAKIDGASKLQQIRYITLPLLVPVITILTLLSVGRIFYADFGLFYNVTRDMGQLYSTTDVIDTYVFRMLRTVGDVGMASAAGFYQSIVGFILVIVSNYAVRKLNKENALF